MKSPTRSSSRATSASARVNARRPPDNWELDLDTGIAQPRSYYIDESELDENVEAAEKCPAKKDRGIIHVIDRREDVEIAPDPHGDGTLSVDW
ncbi:MAG: hypothetical protein J07HN6_00342 [Halonotius sp. J07HN6]|jgi:hypothetical protein|nr:MAG: hypothetical protein J07HN6_00342 [Halonotius sp. J07HN6]